MPVTEKKKAADLRYRKARRDTWSLDAPKGEILPAIDAAAKKAGVSRTRYCLDAIRAQLAKDSADGPEQ